MKVQKLNGCKDSHEEKEQDGELALQNMKTTVIQS